VYSDPTYHSKRIDTTAPYIDPDSGKSSDRIVDSAGDYFISSDNSINIYLGASNQDFRIYTPNTVNKPTRHGYGDTLIGKL